MMVQPTRINRTAAQQVEFSPHGKKGPSPLERDEVSPQEYATFIRQIELAQIWLSEAAVTNRHGPEMPPTGPIEIMSRATWKDRVRGFDALHHYDVRFGESDPAYAKVGVTFGLRFSSEIAMTDRVFAVFSEVNLPVNTWPYLREFLSEIMGRMGWLPFTLPAMKRGTGAPAMRERSEKASARRPSKQSSRS